VYADFGGFGNISADSVFLRPRLARAARGRPG